MSIESFYHIYRITCGLFMKKKRKNGGKNLKIIVNAKRKKKQRGKLGKSRRIENNTEEKATQKVSSFQLY